MYGINQHTKKNSNATTKGAKKETVDVNDSGSKSLRKPVFTNVIWGNKNDSTHLLDLQCN